jgi:uncharacterized membrane protein
MGRVLLIVLVATGSFVLFTGNGLPEVVASHFGAGGAANGAMGKGVYTVFMLVMVIGVPLLVAGSMLLVRKLPPQLVNLPNKRHWLAPERRAQSLEALGSLTMGFAAALSIFLGFVHWLVVRANAVQPPRLEEGWFLFGLGAFGLATLGWLVALYRRFGRPR